MPVLEKRITDSVARGLATPDRGDALYWCPKTPGFGVRVGHTGARAYIAERRVDGKTVRRTLGKAEGAGAISADAARKLQIAISSELQQGVDRVQIKAAARSEAKRDALTFGEAVRQYVEGKRRKKDGLALKQRTKDDYLGMIAQGGRAKNGKPFANGPLHSLADKPAHKITASDIRKVHEAALKGGQRRATYAMQVLRAVLTWHGIFIADSPLGRDAAGKDRIALPPSRGNPRPITAEKLAAWWQAMTQHAGHPGADGLRFMLMTGCRGVEVFGDAHGSKGLTPAACDRKGARVTFQDTKNRQDFTVLLSRQAAELVETHFSGKVPDAPIFGRTVPRKLLMKVNAAVGVKASPHKLRQTFASVAASLVPNAILAQLVNHTDARNVTLEHYVQTDDVTLRAAWQLVADKIAPIDTVVA